MTRERLNRNAGRREKKQPPPSFLFSRTQSVPPFFSSTYYPFYASISSTVRHESYRETAAAFIVMRLVMVFRFVSGRRGETTRSIQTLSFFENRFRSNFKKREISELLHSTVPTLIQWCRHHSLRRLGAQRRLCDRPPIYQGRQTPVFASLTSLSPPQKVFSGQ